MNQTEIKIMGNIEKYGCHVTSVFDPKEEDPNFTYTVGINMNRPDFSRHLIALQLCVLRRKDVSAIYRRI